MFKESLQIQRDAGDETYQALCLNNIGNAYLQKGENEDALTYLQQALQLREKLNVPADIAETLHNLGEAYANLGQYDQAMTSQMRSLELYRKAATTRVRPWSRTAWAWSLNIRAGWDQPSARCRMR
jgi:eukaryotic-like serine/threonine-protein kinase